MMSALMLGNHSMASVPTSCNATMRAMAPWYGAA